ncbi:MAG: hypothetical protein KA369_12805 [Spirochaetes bacterium]|nr:hypothetical protein [Spirochaetota bacterium]
MKKTLMAFIAAVSMLLIVPHAAHSTSLTVGVTGWYAWWDYALKDLDSGKSLPFTAKSKFTLNPAPIYGPVVTLGINKQWSISALFLCGSHYRMSAGFYDLSGVSKESFHTKNMFKYDLDTTVSYAPVSFFKVFVGFKVQSVKEKGNSRSYGILPITAGDPQYYSQGTYNYGFVSYGPGLGVGFTAPLGANFFLLFNVSGIYMRSDLINRESGWSADTELNLEASRYTTRVKLNVWGGNTSLGLAYVFEKAPVTLSLGCRYQFLKNYLANYSETSLDSDMFTGLNYVYKYINRRYLKKAYTKNMDHLWGITLAALYTVNFSK